MDPMEQIRKTEDRIATIRATLESKSGEPFPYEPSQALLAMRRSTDPLLVAGAAGVAAQLLADARLEHANYEAGRRTLYMELWDVRRASHKALTGKDLSEKNTENEVRADDVYVGFLLLLNEMAHKRDTLEALRDALQLRAKLLGGVT